MTCKLMRIAFLAVLAGALAGCVSAPRTREPFRIVSYNMRHGAGVDGTLGLWRSACVVAGEWPRFAGIQEVDRKTKRIQGKDALATLAKATDLHATFAKAIDFDGGEYGVAVLSREVPISVRRVPLPGGEPRVLLLCEFDDCWFGTTHLAVDSEKARTESVAIIRREVAACGSKPVFLTGDWNATPDSEVLAGMKEFLTVLSDEKEPTFHGVTPDEPKNCIDYIAVDSAHRADYVLKGRRTGSDVTSSDHRSVVVDLAPAPAEKVCETDFTIASFNVRCPCDINQRAWYRRMPRVAEVVRRHGFDVFGVQEAVANEIAILETELPNFTYVGCGRDENREGESMLIFYNRNRFECLENGTFWLSETPDKPGSRYEGAGCPRTCTWALLRDRLTGRRFRYFNTHLDHISSKARWNGMQVLLERGVRPAKARGETVLLTGDLNETLDEADTPEAIFELNGPKLAESAKENPIALVSTELDDTYGKSLTPHQGPHKTFHGWRGTPSCRIDYVFATPDVKVLSHATIDDRPDGQFASDHYPVVARVRIGDVP